MQYYDRNECNFCDENKTYKLNVTPTIIVVNHKNITLMIDKYLCVYKHENIYVIELEYKEKYLYANLKTFELMVFVVNKYFDDNRCCFEIKNNDLYLSGWSEDCNDNIVDESCYIHDAYDKYINDEFDFNSIPRNLLNNMDIAFN